MLLLIIDLLERILSWMKSFTGSSEPASRAQTQGRMEPLTPSDEDVRNRYAALKVQYPLKKAPSTKICGVETKSGTRIIPLTKQDSRLWIDMFDEFNEYYNITNA